MATKINTTTNQKSLVEYLNDIQNLISDNKEVEVVTSGSSSKKCKIPLNLKSNQLALKSLKKCLTKSFAEMKKDIKEIIFFTDEKPPKEHSLGNFSKQKSASTSGGAKGRYTEVLSESFFCVYAAFCKKGGNSWNQFKELNVPFLGKDNKPIKWGVFKKWINDNGIKGLDLQLQDTSFQSGFDAEQGSFFLQDMKKDGISFWHKTFVKQAEKIKPYLTKNNYTFVRADNIPDKNNPYKVYDFYSDLLKNEIGFSRKLDGDKWNPADVWIYVENKMVTKDELSKDIERLFTRKNKPLNRTSILGSVEKKEYVITNPAIFDVLNDKIYKLAKSNDVIPVSLKKPGQTVFLKALNDKNSDIKETFKFTGIKFLPTNIDVQLEFEITYKNAKDPRKIPNPSRITGILKMKSFTGGLRLEIIFDKFSARMGSIGTENYTFIIYMTDRKGIRKIKNLREKNNLVEKVGLQSMSGPDWFGGLKYKSFSAAKQKLLKNYAIDLYDAINTRPGAPGKGVDDLRNQNDSNWIATKSAAGEIGLAIAGMDKNKAEKAVKAIFHLASSQGFYIPGDGAKNMQILNSCYHIKLY